MTLGQQQERFAEMLPLLILYIQNLGFKIRVGDVFAREGHCENSFHYKKLAVDLNVFDADGNYLTETIQHEKFGIFWESLGGSWGGSWGDGCHFSLGEGK